MKTKARFRTSFVHIKRKEMLHIVYKINVCNCCRCCRWKAHTVLTKSLHVCIYFSLCSNTPHSQNVSLSFSLSHSLTANAALFTWYSKTEAHPVKRNFPKRNVHYLPSVFILLFLCVLCCKLSCCFPLHISHFFSQSGYIETLFTFCHQLSNYFSSSQYIICIYIYVGNNILFSLFYTTCRCTHSECENTGCSNGIWNHGAIVILLFPPFLITSLREEKKIIVKLLGCLYFSVGNRDILSFR